MKKSGIFAVTAAAALSIAAVSGCGGYKPDESEYYYDNGDTYRVIELDESKTIELKEYKFMSLQTPIIGSTNMNAYTYGITRDTLLFDAIDGLTKATAECIYSYLRIDRSKELVDTAQYFPWSGLCTFNNLQEFKESGIGSWKPYEGGDIIGGYIGDAIRYTFNYSDYSKKNGEVVKSGSFCVLRATGHSVLSKFDYNDIITDLYSVKGADND